MDPEVVKLSTSPRMSRRAIGDPPQIGRVERISRMNQSRGRRGGRGYRGRRSVRRQRRKRLVRVITFLSFIVTLLAVLVICSAWLDKRRKLAAVTLAERPERAKVVERIESKFKSPSEDQALAIINQSIAASDEELVKSSFRLGSHEPSAALAYLKDLNAKWGKPSSAMWQGSVDVNDMLVEGVLLNWRNGDDVFSKQVFLTPDEHGVWRVDFESFAGKCLPSWDAFASGEAAQGVVRIWFSPDNYFNGPFIDDSMWVCYSLARTESDQIVLGYCRVGSLQAAAMTSIMQRAHLRGKGKMSPFRAMLELSRPVGADRRQYEIKRVLSEDWILSDKGFDGAPLR